MLFVEQVELFLGRQIDLDPTRVLFTLSIEAKGRNQFKPDLCYVIILRCSKNHLRASGTCFTHYVQFPTSRFVFSGLIFVFFPSARIAKLQ